MSRGKGGLTIRPALPDDLPSIEKCAKAAYLKYVERIGREPAPMVADFHSAVSKEHVVVGLEAQHTDQPVFVGYVVFYRSANVMQLENIAVLPQLTGRGYGRQLIHHVEDQARQLGCVGVELYTNIKMSENLSYYPSLGYVETGQRTEDGFERVYFFKSLS